MPTDAEFDALQLKIENVTSVYAEDIAINEIARLNSRYSKDVGPIESDSILIQTETEKVLTKVHNLAFKLGKHVSKEYVNYSNEFNTLDKDLKEALRSIKDYMFDRSEWPEEWGVEWGIQGTAQWGRPWGLTWLPLRYTTSSDPQLSNERTALPHKLSHYHGGVDPIDHDLVGGDTLPSHESIDTSLALLLSNTSSLLNRANILSGKLKALFITGSIHNPFVPQTSKSYWGFSWGDAWSETYDQDAWGFAWSKPWGITDLITWGERWGLPYNYKEEGLRWPHLWGAPYVEEVQEEEPPALPEEHC